MSTLIALIGPIGVGKTTLANLLVEEAGYHRTRFADPLKNMLAQFLLSDGVPYEEVWRMLDGDLKEVPTEHFVGRTPRHAMQTKAAITAAESAREAKPKPVPREPKNSGAAINSQAANHIGLAPLGQCPYCDAHRARNAERVRLHRARQRE